MSAPVPVHMIPALAKAVDMVSTHAQIRYATDSGDVLTAHVRGFGRLTEDVNETLVRFSDDFSEWYIPLMEMAQKINDGLMALKR